MTQDFEAITIKKAYPYWSDGEAGRFEFTTHQVCDDGRVRDAAHSHQAKAYSIIQKH